MGRYIKDANDNWQLSSGMPQIDEELDFTSENPVQNKVITSEIQTLENNDDAMLNVLGAKNLLPSNAKSLSVNGITYTVNSDGSITVNGTATDLYFYNIYNLNFTLPKGRYILSGCPSGGGENTYRLTLEIGNDTIRDLGEGVEFELNEDTVVTGCHFRMPSNQTFNNAVVKPMIRPASIEDDTYAPYSRTNTELTGEVEPMLNVLGAKNLLPNTATTQTISGVTFTVNSDGSVNVNGTATGTSTIYFIYYTGNSASTYPLKEGKSYIVSGHPNDLSNGIRIQLEMNGSMVATSDLNGGLFTAPALNNSFKVYIRIPVGETLNNKVFYPMIRPASIQDDTYVPYAMTNRELTITTSETVTFTNSKGGTGTATFRHSGGIGLLYGSFTCKDATNENLTFDLPARWTIPTQGIVIRNSTSGPLHDAWANYNTISTYYHSGTLTVGATYAFCVILYRT